MIRSTLHLSALDLSQTIAASTKLPVKVWNPPAEGKTLPNSPTRVVCVLFLPKEDGGIDTTKPRLDTSARSGCRCRALVVNLASINVTPALLPLPAYEALLRNGEDLFQKYDVQPRELFLRGMIDPMQRRQQRMRVFVDSGLLVGLAEDREFREKELPDWLKKVSAAFALASDDDPKVRAMRAASGRHALGGGSIPRLDG